MRLVTNNCSQTLSFVYLKVSNNQNNSNEEQNVVPVNEQIELPANNPQPPLENEHAGSPETTPLILQTEPPMEVHHHGHVHETKKWKEYLFQFLMLFLAITLGFFVENLREHYIEGERAEALAKNLFKEIYTDSITVQQKLAVRNKKEKECSYFINYVKDSSLTNLSRRFYHSFTWSFIQTAQLMFDPNDGILNQLRNSGELRYFKSSILQSQIGKLSVAINNLRDRNEKEYSYVEFYLRPFTIKYYDFSWYETLTRQGTISLLNALENNGNAPTTSRIVNAEQFDRQEAQNIANYYLLMLRSRRQAYYVPYLNANHQVLQALRDEYDL